MEKSDNGSDKSRASTGSSGSRVPTSVRRSSCHSARNILSDNIQRAHEGRWSPAISKHSSSSHRNLPSPARHVDCNQHRIQPSPTRLADYKRNHNQTSSGQVIDGKRQNDWQSPCRLAEGKRKSNAISPDSSGSVNVGMDQNGNGEHVEKTTGKGKQVVKKQMKQVVGDLETVIGELRTVMGDLKSLVSQIDIVTERLDRNYPDDTDTKRRLSASALEATSSGYTNQKLRNSMSQFCEIDHPTGFKPIQEPPCVEGPPTMLKPTVTTQNNTKVTESSFEKGHVVSMDQIKSQEEATPVRMRIRPIGESKCSKLSKRGADKLSNRHSVPSTSREYDFLYKDTGLDVNQNGFVDIASPMDTKAILDALPKREVLIPPSFFDAIDHDIYTRIVRNKNRCSSQKNVQKVSKSSELSRLKTDCPLFCATGFSDSSWYDTADRSSVRSRESSNKVNTKQRCSPESESPDVEYSGVYERELDETLELEFDDHLDVYDTFNSRDFDNKHAFENAPYLSKYDKNINTWKRYTMEYSSGEHSAEISDDRLSDSVTEHSSDILNDNFLPRTVNPTTVNYSWRTVIEP